ncbi:MAG: class I SAM-dependent methyltransferase [Acidimicrobiia bacterium]
MTAADRWRSELGSWAIPEELLAAVTDSPYRWPVELFKRRNITAEEIAPSPTSETVERLAGPDGSVLDIGAGAGRASLPLSRGGHRITAVEKSSEMAAALREESAGLEGYVVVEEAWPTAVDLGSFDVVMAAHVVYDVPAIEAFLRAMAAHARQGVVLELTEAHPWVPLGPYYRSLHGIDRPDGPTVDDLVDVVREAIGVEPTVDRWERPGGTWFESWEEIVELYRRRLVVPPSRSGEVRSLLEPDVEIHDGRMTVGEPVRRLVTVWWRTVD